MTTDAIQERITEIAARLASQRGVRQRRQSLDPIDFEQLRNAGFLQLAIPVSMGGCWTSVSASAPPICESLRKIAEGDSSLGLVCAMHPTMLSLWLATTCVDEACQGAWNEQRAWVFETARQGAFWGTITSEAGSEGNLNRTRSEAKQTPSGYLITGNKHFGSGLGIASYMVTTAVPNGEGRPELFFIDVRDINSGCETATVTAAWDGHGMIATQSHSVRFDGHRATRFAWPGEMGRIVAATGGFFGCAFSSVIVGIVDAAMRCARNEIQHRAKTLGSYQRALWVDIEVSAWNIKCCYDNIILSLHEQNDSRRTALIGKLAISELAESVLANICRLFGGGTYSRESPYGFLFEDVRALGFLRPPWALTYEMLLERLLPE